MYTGVFEDVLEERNGVTLREEPRSGWVAVIGGNERTSKHHDYPRCLGHTADLVQTNETMHAMGKTYSYGSLCDL